MKTLEDRVVELQGRIPVLAKEYANDRETFLRLQKEIFKKLKVLYKRIDRRYYRDEVTKRKIQKVEDIPYLPTPITTFHYDILYNIGVLRKEQLEDGKYYLGECRNAHVAMWDVKNNCFWYMRYKFGDVYAENINHLADDDGSDVFVPIKEVEPEEHEIVYETYI